MKETNKVNGLGDFFTERLLFFERFAIMKSEGKRGKKTAKEDEGFYEKLPKKRKTIYESVFRVQMPSRRPRAFWRA